MNVWIVIDTKGSGRIVGAFSSESRALKLTELDRHYFRMSRHRVNRIDARILDWALSDHQRAQLAREIAGGD